MKESKPPSPEDLLKEFRAYLHLVITARQLKRSKELDSLPGSQITAYCRALAELPDNTLARELAAPVLAIVDQISEIAGGCEGTLRRKDPESVAMHLTARQILNQLDLAFGFILRDFDVQVSFRSEATEDMDLLVESTRIATNAGDLAARLVRRFQQLDPDDCLDKNGSVAEGGFPESFAWDTYVRVAALDRLADEFPDHVRFAARQMHAWPMLTHRHTNNRRRFAELAEKLELGADYPMDASEGARWRPDTPLVRYLVPVVQRLHSFHYHRAHQEFETIEKENESLQRGWWQWPEELPDENVIQVLRSTRRLPALTKATAVQWADKSIVPLILATDAKDWQNCKEPVLRRIAKQKGVKSRATFKSRLLAAVTATLRRLARPA